MLNLTKSITISGYSYVEKTVENTTDGTTTYTEKVPAVYLSADVAENGSDPHISFTIQNKELYLANKKDCDKDISEFYTNALSLIE